LDGELLAWRGESPLPFAALQHRLGRKTASMKIRNEFPVEFVAYDLLEYEGLDCRAWPLTRRRHELEKIVSALATTAPKMDSQQIVQTAAPFLPGFDNPSGAQKSHAAPCGIRLSPLITPTTWSQLAEFHRASRGRGVEGLMLKKKDSIYGVGRQRGDWWKWKIDPFLIDAVLVAAQSGHGRRASLYTDYTFALWENGKLVPMAKAYSGLSDEEILQVDAFVRQNISERFGPVRSVKPLQVFELAFEGVQQSARHKSGIAVRFPRINRWRRDKKPEEADTMENLRALAKLNEPSS
jgi:DNA ligase-1